MEREEQCKYVYLREVMKTNVTAKTVLMFKIGGVH
jgi:hypothetical protein